MKRIFGGQCVITKSSSIKLQITRVYTKSFWSFSNFCHMVVPYFQRQCYATL